ncbi:MAG TPA: hypothetical protein VGE93_23155, partial [Bryobacteraceae bacterium]
MQTKRILSLLCPAVLAAQLYAAQPAAGASQTPANPTAPTSSANNGEATSPANNQELQQLRERIAEQEQAIKQLQEAVEEQRALLDKAVQSTNTAAAKAADGTATANNLAPAG